LIVFEIIQPENILHSNINRDIFFANFSSFTKLSSFSNVFQSNRDAIEKINSLGIGRQRNGTAMAMPGKLGDEITE
jgi:hypothetical protein